MQQAISNIRASQTQWHFHVGEAPPFEPIEIDAAVLRRNEFAEFLGGSLTEPRPSPETSPAPSPALT